MPSFHVIALTLPGQPDPAVAIAATRDGGWGDLDLEYIKDKDLAVDSIKQLCRYAKGECGIKLDGSDTKFCHEVVTDVPRGLQVVILTFSTAQKLRKQVATLHRRKLKVLLETTSWQQAKVGQSIGVDGIIAKGHEAGGRVGEETTFILLENLLKHSPLPVFAHGGVGQRDHLCRERSRRQLQSLCAPRSSRGDASAASRARTGRGQEPADAGCARPLA